MERVMSIVNNLLLRRDRDAEQRENLSVTIRSLRADFLRQSSDQESLQEKRKEAQRKLGIAEATERAMKLHLKSAEQATRGLREDMAKMKSLVAQTRAQCANEVRKREKVIEGMKKHVGEGGRARGSGKMVGVVNVTVTAGVGAETNTMGTVSTSEPGYDLRMETNQFLTELASGLSEENENMGALLRRTVGTLRSLSGCENEGVQKGGIAVQMENGYDDLAAEMDFVIEHLRNLLTNPSFVPLEEVEVREEEIIRLREGWEKMETRWKEAIEMMDGWRKRMTRSGQTVNLEELKMGLLLSPLKFQEEPKARNLEMSTLMEEGEGDTQADIDAMEEEEKELEIEAEQEFDDDLISESGSSLFEEEPLEDVESESTRDEFSISRAKLSSPVPEAPQLSPLHEITDAINRGHQGDAFSTIIEENTYDLQLAISSPQKFSRSTPQSQKQENTHPISPPDEVSFVKPASLVKPSPRKVKYLTSAKKAPATPRLKETKESSRLPRPRDLPPQQSPLTMASIAAKLAATEREADAARVRAKLKAARMKSAAQVDAVNLMPPPTAKHAEPTKSTWEASEEADAELGAVRKRKAQGRQGGRANRRRSTLSPWELESLILGGVGAE
ncbi:Afadin and alpha-actinin-binding-domain-containing protein [Calycina marina]|uniref:Afadin and alpha-actinin-binding-domain-containing protein n=1 Tax=Calycina marina TaxID=1763456 RepID=A0A9P8CH37_9HELO|nr:Afadin and alpha-actinin-binding-domain-containing protein [Calycina marina]